MFQAIILGIIQGLTEFLPVSSTAHLVLAPWFLGWNDPGLAFDAVLHLGTLAGILVFFWRDFCRIIYGMLGMRLNSRGSLNESNTEGMMGWYIIIGTIPAGIAGLALEHKIETVFRSPRLIGITLILFAIILWWSETKGRKIRKTSHMNMLDAITIGFAQAVAVIPGVSRSGITITAGLFRNLERETAARFAFLLSAPIILAGGLLSLMHVYKAGFPAGGFQPLIAGFITSAISGFLAIKYLLKYLSRHKVNLFVYYRIVLGIILLFLT